MKEGETHESKAKHHQRTHGMRQHAPAEYARVHGRDDKIPQEIARRQSLDHAGRARIPPHTLLQPHGAPLVVLPDDPQRQRVDQQRLAERHGVHVPVDLGPSRQMGVDGRKEPARDQGREVGVDELVPRCGDEDLVCVQRESRKGEEGRQGLGRAR